MSVPLMETLRQIRDTVTNRVFPCSTVSLSMPQEWRTSIQTSATGNGAVDGHAGGVDYLSPRAIDVTLIVRYNAIPGDNFDSASARFELVCNRGNPLELTFLDRNNNTWYLEGVRLTKYDKKMSKDQAILATIPVSFVAPDPRQKAQYTPGQYLLNNNELLNNGWLLNDNPNVFDLDTAHAFTQKFVDNTNLATAPDEAPKVVLTGPIVGWIQAQWNDDAGNYSGWVYAASVDAGETLTVDGEQPEVTSSNPTKNPYPLLTILNPNQEGYGSVQPGMNVFTVYYTSAGAGSHCVLGWSPRK